MMKEPRIARSRRERKGHLSPDAERLVASALGLANSGSRVEDRYWERQLADRIDRLLDSGHQQSLYNALDRLQQTDGEAYGALVEAVEECAESVIVDHDGAPWQVLLVSAPLIAWTRFRIPSGGLPPDAVGALSAHWHAHVLSRSARLFVTPHLYSLDELPRDYTELRKLTRRLGDAALTGRPLRLDFSDLPETADMLADSRFLIGAVAVPAGDASFRWQELDSEDHATRIQCLEHWVSQVRPVIEPLLPGCGFECLLPDAYHINLRESDRRVRPNAIRAGVHYLSHALALDPGEIRAVVAPFGDDQVDEYRIGLSVDPDGEEVAHGIVWPLFGAESEEDDPSPVERIREILRDAGVTEQRLWPDPIESEYCEDCGAPLFPNENGDVVHAEMPADVEPGSSHFH
jgi:hypothetical protein